MIKMFFEYIDNNKDKTIVFLHGWGMRSSCFDQIICNLKNKYSIFKIDLSGFGSSDNPPAYFDTYEYAYQIFLYLKNLELNNIVLVGHSFGGRLSILLSSIFNINIVDCLLTSSAGLNRFNFFKYIKIKKYKIIKYLVNKKIIQSNIMNKYGSADYRQADVIMKSILKRVVNQNLKLYLNLIRCNTILVWDKKDKDTPFWIAKYLNKKILNSSMVVFKTGGHFTAFKNPNKFANILNSLD